MSPADAELIVPERVARLLASGDEEAAGELLREHAESLARTSPGLGRSWSERAVAARFDEPLFGAYVRWSAGAVFHLVGEPDLARSELEAASSSLARAGRRDLADRVSLLLVDVYGEKLLLPRARATARRLERSFAERGDTERSAVALANLGCAEDAADRVDRARALWRQALRRLDPGGFRHLLARANLANSAALMGRFAEAGREHREVAEAARKLGLDALALQAELNLAEAELAVGQVEAALRRWHEVIGRARSSGDAATELIAEIDLAAAEAELGDLEGARRRLEAVQPRVQAVGLRREEVRTIRLLAVLAGFQSGHGAWRAAMRRLQGPGLQLARDLATIDLVQLDPACEPHQAVRAAERLEKAGLHHRAAVGLAWAARRLLENGRRRAAVRRAREALSARGSSAWVRMVAYQVLGRAGGPGGTRHLFRAVHWADRLHGRLSAAADRAAFLRLRGDVYLDLVGALLERGRASDRVRALDILSRFRSGWLLDELGRRADRGDDPEVRHWQELRARLASLLGQLEGQDEPRVRRFGVAVLDELRSLDAQLRASEVVLARRWPELLADEEGSVTRRLLERLPAGDAFVEYFLGRRDLLTFVAAAGRLTVRRDPVAGEIRRLIGSVRFHMDTHTWRDASSAAASAEALRERLRRLGSLLLCSVPEQQRVLWLAPHAELFHLPWAAIETPDGTTLLDRGVFSLSPGAASVAALLEEAPGEPASFAVCGAAGDDLPMVGRELEAMARFERVQTVLASATCQDLLGALESHDVVHLAGHAVFLDGLPAASGLRLADGYVTVHDLAASRLRARLVSFGVCSGVRIGEEEQHYEGFLRSLLAGGVRTVIGAVAPVRDEVAYDFDVELVRRLVDGGDPGAAYREAVGELRRRDSHPATWGNFHFYGDPRSWRRR